MGIFELAQSGSNLTRKLVSISSSPATGKTTGFGTSYILLGVQTQGPCRIRLYSDSASVDIDNSRPTSSFDINPSVGLVLDTELTGSVTRLIFNPPIIGTTFSGSETWHNISSSAAQTATFTAYPIEFAEFPSRTILTFSGSNIDTGSTGVEGNITSPKGFLILSGSADTGSRLRLYSRPIDQVPLVEKVRAFGENPITGSSIIADMAFDSASFSYKLSPSLEAYNLESYSNGNNLVGFILQNQSTTNGATITASLLIYPTEN